jgi:hypothetical protein
VEWLERGRKLLEFKRAVVIWQWRDEGEGLDYFSLYFLLKVYFFSSLYFFLILSLFFNHNHGQGFCWKRRVYGFFVWWLPLSIFTIQSYL